MSKCIEWQGCRKATGYGQRQFRGKVRAVHRIAYVEHHGLEFDDIDGMCVLHHCDNPPCINPEHLFLGTHADNMKDKAAKGRSRTGNLKGSAVGSAKLTEADVPYIRYMLSIGVEQKVIAERFGVSSTTICHINTGTTWSHV